MREINTLFVPYFAKFFPSEMQDINNKRTIMLVPNLRDLVSFLRQTTLPITFTNESGQKLSFPSYASLQLRCFCYTWCP